MNEQQQLENQSDSERSETYLGEPATHWAHRSAATRLRNALRLNGEFSLTTGLIATVAGGPVADLLGIDYPWLVRAVGLSLLGFAIVLFLLAGQRTKLVVSQALQISIADIGWVVGTVVVVALGWVSTVGAVVLGVIALVVLELAILQLRARSATVRTLEAARSRAGRSQSDGELLNEFPPVEVVEVNRNIKAEPDRLWPIITDHELYARLAFNLGGASGLTPNGPGMRRACTDGAGRSWSETCTLWDEGRRFAISVDIDGSDDAAAYPYPLQVMEGSWGVEPSDGATSDVAMRFAFRPKRGLRGRVFVPLMHVMFKPILGRIGRGWATEAATRP